MKIGVIDYDAGNLKSVETALHHLNADFLISDNPDNLKGVDKLIFPGVGEARSAMANLKQRGMDDFIVDFFNTGKPILGICLGSQILLEHSEERDTPCLGLIPGKAVRFANKEGFKIPQIGWNSVTWEGHPPLFEGIPQESSFYFVHSYHTQPDKGENILASSQYSQPFVCALQRDNLMATQFHPEKSGPYGLKMLQNFMERIG